VAFSRTLLRLLLGRRLPITTGFIHVQGTGGRRTSVAAATAAILMLEPAY
jgi:hypothetical protein